jgi:hypothetical protein
MIVNVIYVHVRSPHGMRGVGLALQQCKLLSCIVGLVNSYGSCMCSLAFSSILGFARTKTLRRLIKVKV